MKRIKNVVLLFELKIFVFNLNCAKNIQNFNKNVYFLEATMHHPAVEEKYRFTEILFVLATDDL